MFNSFVFLFSGQQIVTDISIWGVFGDFFGGTINSIVGIINLALLAAISIYVAKFDSHRQFNEYRYKIYVDLCTKFDETKDTADGLEELKEFTKIFSFNNQFLFPKQSNEIFNSVVEGLILTIDKLIPIKEKYEEDVNSGIIKNIPIPRSLGRELETAFKYWPETETEESLALKDFSTSKKRILGFIQSVMIEGNINKYRKV
jgi:hypothetical protein